MMKTRTVGAIALQPTRKSQGGYLFLSLARCRLVDWRSWTELPMPADVIERVHALARHSKSVSGLTFGWRSGFRIVDDDKYEDHNDRMEDPDYKPANDGYAHDAIDKDDYEYDAAAYYNNRDPVDYSSKANHVPLVVVVESD